MASNYNKISPLVLLHAYLADHTLWDLTRTAIKTETCIIAPDLPGFGNTPVLSSAPSMDALADYVAANLKKQGFTQVTVAGMSMGGYVALAMAERYPDMVAGLGLISTQIEADSPAMRRLRRTIVANVRKHGPSAATQALVEKLFSRKRQNDLQLTQFAVQSAKTASADGICWAMEAMSGRQDHTEFFKGLQIPLVVVHGTEDAYTPIERAREMSKINPKAQFIEVPGGGHATPWESPGIVAGALLGLVEQVR